MHSNKNYMLKNLTYYDGISASKNTLEYNEETANKITEKAYFDGQKDAIRGDIRIQLNKDSIYVWVKSPWNSGSRPISIPTE